MKMNNQGFNNIYYKGRPVERDLSAKTDYIVVARNRLHRWWLTKVRRIPADKVFYLSAFKGSFDFKVDPEQSMPVPHKGRVVKSVAAPEYDPDHKVTGGKVTRIMPRQLQKIKAGQEKASG